MRRTLAFLVGLLAALPASAQDWATREVCDVETPAIHAEVFPDPGLDALTAEAALIPNHRGRFWQITAPNGAVSHLWGTYHSSDPHILRLPEAVREAIGNARVVAPEFDAVAPTREAVRRLRWAIDFYKDAGDPFENLLPESGTIAGLSPEVSAWVSDRLFDIGWGEDGHLAISTAGLASILLWHPCEDFAAGTFPLQDGFVQLLGTLGGAETLGLEGPWDILIDLKNSEKSAKAVVAVYASYLRPETDNRGRSTSFKLYLEGRIGLMMTWDGAFVHDVLGSDGIEALRLTDDYLLRVRNIRFLDTAQEELTKGGLFIAVGAFHLPGEDGLVEMLRREGFTVTRIPLPGEAP